MKYREATYSVGIILRGAESDRAPIGTGDPAPQKRREDPMSVDYILISTSTPAGRLSDVSDSIVFAFGSRISTIRL